MKCTVHDLEVMGLNPGRVEHEKRCTVLMSQLYLKLNLSIAGASVYLRACAFESVTVYFFPEVSHGRVVRMTVSQGYYMYCS